MLVLAGAGSGKTRVLTHRLAYLIHRREVHPNDILAITFTNKAAREMRERCEALIGDSIRGMWIGTFHGIGLRILRLNAERLGYSSSFAIFDRADQQRLIKDILKEQNLSEKQWQPNAILDRISRAKNDLLGPADFKPGDYFEQKVADLYVDYQKRLFEYNAMDFDDLIRLTTHLLLAHPDIGTHYAEKFQHVLVDEYQDTNHAQYRLIKAFSKIHRNIFAVGDSDQSIYGWRGADIGNILRFESDFPEADIYKLEQNYRSTSPILEAAHRIIRHNAARQEKELWTRRDGGDPVIFYHAPSAEMEARFVVSYIEQLAREENRPWSDFAILYRTHAQSRLLEMTCHERSVPFRILGSVGFYDRTEVRDALSLLRVIANPQDWVSVRRIINRPKRGIGPASLDKIQQFAEANGLNIHEVLANPESVPGLNKPQRLGLARFGQGLISVLQDVQQRSPAEILEAALDAVDYWTYLDELEPITSFSRRDNLRELIASAQQFVVDVRRGLIPGAEDIESQGQGALLAFLNGVALVTDVDTYEESENQVTLLTLHSAKGLEFPVVFMVGLEEGLFPHARSLLESTALEEERRLCYVGMTRAEDRLIMTSAASRSYYGEYPSPTVISRFIDEIGEDMLAELEPRESESCLMPPADHKLGASLNRSAPKKEKQKEMSAPKVKWQAGEKVRHRVWGEGRIVGCQRREDDVELTIVFDSEGLKTVVADYAPLEQVKD